MSKPKITPIIDMPSKEQMLQPYDEDFGDGLESKIKKLMEFFDQSGINYDKFDPEATPKLDLGNKKAYPNYDQYMYMPGQHNTQKWLQTVKDVYYKEKDGVGRVKAIRQATASWNPMETFDFLNWLKFYEEGAHMKYKMAQVWYENGAPGYFLHVKPDQHKEETQVSGKDIDFARDTIADEVSSSEKKRIIEKQRQKIIGRLDSAEKLLRTQDGQMFAGKELESLMEAIYNLKKKVQLVNKISTSTRLYEDMIVREANALNKKGFVKAAGMLYSVAQAPPVPPPAPPAQGSGSAGGLPSVGPGMAQNPPESAPNETSTIPKGISEFLSNLQTSKMTTSKDDKLGVDDNLEIDDSLEVEDGEDGLLVTEAQVAPDVPMIDKPNPPPLPKVKEKPLEVSEEDIGKKPITPMSPGDFGEKIDQVFANVTVTDVITEFEFISNFYKAREIPRRLSRADMMLDSLGLASFFPSLAEAQNKALESNNYISSRVEEILSKLRGSVKSKDVELSTGEPKESSPEVEGIKQKLQSDDEKEKARKQMRKNLETQELEGKNKETPEIEIEEDLGAPPAPPKTPVAPKAPPVPLA